MHCFFHRASALILFAAVTAPLLAAEPQNRSADSSATAPTRDMSAPQEGVALLIPTAGNQVRGIITLNERDGTVHVTGKVIGLSPGKHGFHIHQYGDLRSSDGTSAGGHYDPKGDPHGGPDDEKHHAGDLGNIEANEDGVAEVDKQSDELKVHFVVGRAIVVHAGADDLKSQPSGDAGPRVAVGVIGYANVEDSSDKKQDSQ